MIRPAIPEKDEAIDPTRLQHLVDEAGPMVGWLVEINGSRKVIKPCIATVQVNLGNFTSIGKEKTRQMREEGPNWPLKKE